MRVLVLGGSGNFGARIVRALQDDPRIELISASRAGAPVPGAEQVRAVALDRQSSSLAAQLQALQPQLVIHCAGPFQGQDYAVAHATLSAGAHYLDLCDDRSFVSGFEVALDAQARQAGLVALTGVSTLPTLSAAVVDHIAGELRSVTTIHTVIAPGQRASRGVATLAAVCSYLGRPFPVWQGGRWQQAWGWMGLERVDLPVGRRLCAWCDVPDLELLVRRYAGVQSITFKAALEFAPQHLGLWLLAALRRAGVPLPIHRWAPLLDRLAGCWDKFAGNAGGMRVRVTGVDRAGKAVVCDWQVTAAAELGPEIPCMAAVVLTRRMAGGRHPVAGARPCLDELTLADFAESFERFGMRTGYSRP